MIPLALSAFTHLWNVVGFPSIHIDESHYMRRTMMVMSGQGPQDLYYPYDHPYFGQIFLAWVLGAIGYPNSLHPSTDVHSIEMLFLVPRMLMGILAVVDTFLVYKICEYRYNNRTVAFIASILFAVVPMTWLLRRIYLDNISMPFLLSSILFAIYCKRNSNEVSRENNYILTLFSGIFLGIAIFTKIPAFTMIPLVAFLLVYTGGWKKDNDDNDDDNTHDSSSQRRLVSLGFSKKNMKMLGLWFIPVIIIPMLWPIYSISVGQFSIFWEGVLHQTHRIVSTTLLDSISTNFQMDPFLLTIGIVGIVFAAIKRDFMLLLWIIPFTIFLYFVTFVQYYYIIEILPAFCIAAAVVIANLLKSIKNKKYFRVVQVTAISGITIFGLVSTIILIGENVNATFFRTYAYAASLLPNSGNDNKEAIIGTHWWIWTFFWIAKYVFHKEFSVIDLVYHDNAPGIVTQKLSGETVHFVRFPLDTPNILFFGDINMMNIFSELGVDEPLLINVKIGNSNTFLPLQQIYNNTPIKATFIDNTNTSKHQGYPYTNIPTMTINEYRPEGKIEIRANN
jgi:hypothetical protein